MKNILKNRFINYGNKIKQAIVFLLAHQIRIFYLVRPVPLPGLIRIEIFNWEMTVSHLVRSTFILKGDRYSFRLTGSIQINTKPGGPVEPYDLLKDPEEKNNLAGKYPAKVKKLNMVMKEAIIKSALFPFKNE